MTDPNDTVEPVVTNYSEGSTSKGGLTKREHFALEFAKVLVSLDYDRALAESVRYADILNEKTET